MKQRRQLKKFLLNVTTEKIGTIMMIGAITMATLDVIMMVVQIIQVMVLVEFILLQFTEFVTDVVVIVTIGGEWKIYFLIYAKSSAVIILNLFRFIN